MSHCHPQKFIDDPTFFCLLFAILYCGASAAPEAHWTSDMLQGECKDTILKQLKAAYTASLSQSFHLEHPTINTLVSMLLTGPFINPPHESMQSLVSISTTVRIAQSMGLHREATWSELSIIKIKEPGVGLVAYSLARSAVVRIYRPSALLWERCTRRNKRSCLW